MCLHVTSLSVLVCQGGVGVGWKKETEGYLRICVCVWEVRMGEGNFPL